MVVVDYGVSGPARAVCCAVRVGRPVKDAQVIGVLRELESADTAPMVPNVVYVIIFNLYIAYRFKMIGPRIEP